MMRLLISLLLILTLTGCSSFKSENEPVEVESIRDASDGFYIKEENTCRPLIIPTEMDTLLYDRTLQGEETSFLLSKSSRENLPTLNSESEIIYKSEEDINYPIFLASLSDLGFTLGFKLEPKGDSFIIKDRSTVEGSSIQTALEENGLKNKRLLSVGGVVLSPSHLDNSGFIKDLEEDKNYSLIFLEGTVESEIEAQADTLTLKLSPEQLIGEVSLKYTEAGYAAVSFNSLDPGYYLLLIPDKLKIQGGIFYVPE